ncbi:MAG: imidazoleglycerol-phosphate dehydratase HisB [Ruminococcaceae bacterium]|nr:imidazoleglycerol-phosphate dehydratase HisB [Oscillospiraceae bacterium]
MKKETIITRNTAETKIELSLCLDGTGEGEIATGCGFLDHMLVLFKKHGRFDLTVRCEGDTEVDYHHTAEDIGIVLGGAFAECLGEMRGIRRYADKLIPMDEALILCAVDISGRAHLEYALDIPSEKVGDFDTELVKEFWLAFVRTAKMTLHLRQISGENSHHIIEGAFKAAARAIGEACSVDERFADEIPSTKGVL